MSSVKTNMSKKISNVVFVAKVAYAAYCGYIELLDQEDNQSERRWWVRELNLRRDKEGFNVMNFDRMKERDPEHFYKITRMSPQAFDVLRALIEPHLEKTSWRKPIGSSARLFLCILSVFYDVHMYIVPLIKINFL